ncbi:carboxypeptidase-like regulatory domain-containing protein [Marivirga tractuosa]|uniref:carboxypeptidase-like regulatory domain-containing protein n=1 Tax=Marivirga tractuosa TaxID=1006 RepID=UPI0035CFF82D
MRYLFLFTFLIHFNPSFSQFKGVLIDEKTERPVPYASVYLKNQQKGTSSSFDGWFTIELDKTDTLIISSVGYQKLELAYSELNDTIFLALDIREMKVVEVQNKKKLGLFKKRNKLGNVKTSYLFNDNWLWMGTAGYPYEIARFFEFKEEFSETRFVESVAVETISDVNGAIFSLKFYRLGADSLPAELINKNTIIGSVKKGRNITKIEIEEEVIYFPEDGMFIAVEFLIVEQNRVSRDLPVFYEGSSYEAKYSPSFSVLDTEDNFYQFDIIHQKWTRMTTKIRNLECEITLIE